MRWISLQLLLSFQRWPRPLWSYLQWTLCCLACRRRSLAVANQSVVHLAFRGKQASLSVAHCWLLSANSPGFPAGLLWSGLRTSLSFRFSFGCLGLLWPGPFGCFGWLIVSHWGRRPEVQRSSALGAIVVSFADSCISLDSLSSCLPSSKFGCRQSVGSSSCLPREASFALRRPLLVVVCQQSWVPCWSSLEWCPDVSLFSVLLWLPRLALARSFWLLRLVDCFALGSQTGGSTFLCSWRHCRFVRRQLHLSGLFVVLLAVVEVWLSPISR